MFAAYYYPTAKKRYLPRIQKVTEEIVRMPEAIAAQDWVAVADFGKVADNAVLPLQLYVSSLDGQGLSMANSYAKQMKVDALDYEKAYKLFVKALKIQNGDQILQAVTAMGVAVADYRIVGHLSDDDGNLPVSSVHYFVSIVHRIVFCRHSDDFLSRMNQDLARECECASIRYQRSPSLFSAL